MTLVAEHSSTTRPPLTALPVAIIGAGPVGLAAAAHLLERDIEPLVLEQGDRAGAAIRQWGHIRLFSPWRHVVDLASVRLLEPTGWRLPAPETAPLGADFVDQYVDPLAAVLGDRIRYRARVEHVSRLGMDRTRTAGRAEAPFVLRLDDGSEVQARAVIDASGTFTTPNPVIASGLPPRHLDSVADHLTHGLPDVLGLDRQRFAGRHTVVVGAGHSAANTLIALGRLIDQDATTTATWVVRGAEPIRDYDSESDELSDRAQLGAATRELVETGRVRLVARCLITDVEPGAAGRVRIIGTRAGEPTVIEADTIVVATGFRPDLDMLREIRLRLDEVVEAPAALAPLIDPNLHSCGTVRPHGVEELSHPEPNFWLAGMKSYGRAPTFLLLTGYEQVRSIADELAGEHAAARRVELVLPETGVCSTSLPTETSCCAPSSETSCCA